MKPGEAKKTYRLPVMSYSEGWGASIHASLEHLNAFVEERGLTKRQNFDPGLTMEVSENLAKEILERGTRCDSLVSSPYEFVQELEETYG